MRKIRGFLKLMRPLNLLIVIYASFVAFLISGLCGHPAPFFKFLIPILLLAGFSNAFNDIKDARLDEKAHPERPIPSKLLSVQEATVFTVILGLLTFLSSFLYGNGILTTRIVFLLGLVLVILYDIYLKKVAFVGNLIVSFVTSFPFLILALEIRNFHLLWYPILCAILYNLAREAIKDMEDLGADREFGYKTLPAFLGEKGIKIYVSFLLFLLSIFTVIAYLRVFHRPIFLIFMCFLWLFLGIITWKEKSFSKLSEDFKYCMILILSGFLLGGAL